MDPPARIGDSRDRADFEQSGMGRHKHQHDQAIGAGILYGVFFPRIGMGCHAGQEFPPICPDLHESFTLEHIVDLVGSLMLMCRLFLSWLEAIDIAEHAVGFKEIDFLELPG
jgi:hypothetical protein